MKREPMNSGENQAPLVVRQYVYQHYLMLLEGSTEPMVICRGANIDFVNSAAARLMGASDRNRLIEHALLDFVTPAFHAPVERYLAEAMAGNGDNGPLEVELRRIDGSMFSARLRRSYLALDGNPAVQLSVSDVSERVASERRQEHLRLALEASEVGWWDWSIASGAIYLDRSAARMLQLSEDELNTTVELCTSFVHPDDAARLFPAAEADALREDQPWHAEFRVLHAGSVTWSGIRGRVVERDREGAALRMAGTLQPMSERRESARRLALLSQYDGLTGLPNRVLFRDRLSLAISRAKRNQALVGVVFLNLDRFARINDTLGPATGDRLLQEIAIRLRHNMREADTIGRLGGDEFTLIVEQAEEPLQLERVAEKIRGALSAPLLVAGQEIYLNASIGLSIYPRDSEDAEQLLKNADIAMYRAKSHGGNAHLFYSPEMATTSVQRLSLEAELRRALEREEFVLHYQPIFDVVSGAVLGAEALVRWQSPKGMIGPNEFISIAEETGLIFELGAWVLLTACTQAIEWQQAGLPLRIAVNLSPRQFLQPDLLQIVAGALDKTGLPPQLLALEITEGMLMHQHESIPDTLSCLNRLGIRIAIDDFGTGYSSLSYLKRFQVQELKIDRSFVRGLPGNADDAAIVTAIASMAKSLGMRLIAEGVESEAQLSFVRRLGCDAVQGFLLGKPAHAEEFARRFIEARATSMITSPDFR